jgi:hypothetical protein
VRGGGRRLAASGFYHSRSHRLGRRLRIRRGASCNRMEETVIQSNQKTENLPPRVETLRSALASEIPCSPNSPEVRAELDALPMGRLLSIFYNWAGRLIPQRRRTLDFASGFWDERALRNEAAVYELVERVRRGEDLTPYLSNQARTDGYVPRPAGVRRGPQWGGKDFALNAWDVHHLHLSPGGTNDLMYATFGRDFVLAVMVGDHKSFDDGSLEGRVLEARARSGHMVMGGMLGGDGLESKQRIALARHGITSAATVDSQVVLGAMLSSDGSSTRHTMMVIKAQRSLREYDPKIDEPGWLASVSAPSAQFIDPQWSFIGTDLCIVSTDGQAAIRVVDGRC